MNEHDDVDVSCKTESLSSAAWWLGNKDQTLIQF